MDRPWSRIVGAVIVATILALSVSAGASAHGRIEATRAWAPLDPDRILDRAALAPLSPFSPRPFAVSSARIRTLAWKDLPTNGSPLRSLKRAPGSDAQGITFKIVSGRRFYSPGNLASDGERYVDGYVRTGNPAYLDRALVRARKLLSLSVMSGGGRYFAYELGYASEGLSAPWFSAYSQGFALSLFVRLYRVTGDRHWADRARETALSFRRLGPSSRPWVAYAPNGYLWLEEYPSAQPSHVLNGFVFALFGLYDYERLTRDPTAHALLEGALRTIRAYGARYRVPGGLSYYDLVHRSQSLHYHEIHIWQLRDLTAISGDPWYARLAALLRADHG